MTRAEELANKSWPIHPPTILPKAGEHGEILNFDEWLDDHRIAVQSLSAHHGYIQGYEQAEKETIQRIKELLKVRIVERTERCQEDWSNRQKDRVNIRNDEDGDIILVLEKLEEE